MKVFNLRGNSLPLYSTLGEILYYIEKYCQWGHFEEDHIKEDYFYTSGSSNTKYYIHYWNYNNQYLKCEEKYKFNKSKAKQLVEEKYVDVVVGNNYGINYEKLPDIIHDYLRLTNQLDD